MKSLQLKKHRDRDGVFLVEGEKSVLEFINSKFHVQAVYGTERFINNYRSILSQKYIEFETISENTLISIGTYQSNNAAIAIVSKPTEKSFNLPLKGYALALDDINDPGNLGTIIRVADWYGITTLLLSTDTTDVFNPKVVNSSKGSLSRVEVFYVDLGAALKGYNGTVYSAMLNGENVHNVKFGEGGIILMGSESHGVNKELLELADRKIAIPGAGNAESLNVAVATAIICDNIARSLED